MVYNRFLQLSNKYILAKKHQDIVIKEEDLFRLLIFFPIILLSQEIYLLPDDAHTLMSSYNIDIKKAKKEIFIFSAYLDEYSLTATLKRLTKQNIPITIISQSPLKEDNKISYLSLMKNVSVFTLRSFDSDSIKGSFICIDDKKYYMINTALDHDKIKTVHSFASYQEGPCTYLFKTLIKRSDPY